VTSVMGFFVRVTGMKISGTMRPDPLTVLKALHSVGR
jgi:hypothetical protein